MVMMEQNFRADTPIHLRLDNFFFKMKRETD